MRSNSKDEERERGGSMKYMSSAAKQLLLRERVGEQRIVKKFLMYPRRFGAAPSRVFEYAYLVEEVQVVERSFDNSPRRWDWVEIEFADDVEEVVITRRSSPHCLVNTDAV